MGKSRQREHGQMEVQRLEGGGAFRERWVCGLEEEYSGGQMPGWRGGGRAGHEGHGHLAGMGHSPLEMTVGQSMRCPEAPCSPDRISFEYPGDRHGKRKAGEQSLETPGNKAL